MEFINLKFRNITFEHTGNLILLEHQLPTTVLIKDSKFTELASASIIIQSMTTLNSSATTNVKLLNSEFSKFSSSSSSFISVYEGGILEIEN
jgi:hypothetical protein